jgi:hypothetical protein
MRHSDLRLTMATYTDAKLLDVSDALNSLPKLTPNEKSDNERDAKRATGTDGNSASEFPPGNAQGGRPESSAVILAGDFGPMASDTANAKSLTAPAPRYR